MRLRNLPRRFRALALGCAAALSAATPARADLFGNFEHGIDNIFGQALDMMPPGLHGIRLGLGPSVQPNFLGDSQKTTRLSPVISLRYRNFVEVDNNAIRVNVLGNWGSLAPANSPWSAGPSINIDWGRATSDSPKLQGIGGIPTSFELGAYVAYRDARTRYRLRARRDIAGATSGWLVDGQIDHRIVDSPKLFVTVGVQATWVNGRYMSRWFGITPGQAAASGLPAYQAHAGVRDVSLRASAEYLLNDRWSVLGTVSYMRLLGSAANNPLVKRRGSPNQPSAGAFVIYAF